MGRSPSPIGVSRVEEFFVNEEDRINAAEQLGERDGDNVEFDVDNGNVEPEVESPFHASKRTKRSKVWDDFKDPELINGKWKRRCKHCNSPLAVTASKSTSHFNRHLDTCTAKVLHLKQQNMLNFMPSDSSDATKPTGFISALHNGKLDMLKMREGMAHWITMHEHPFTIVEEEGFNLMLKRGIPQWTSVSRNTIRSDCFKLYEFEKEKLKALLKKVDRISLTTDLWKSKPQKIEYMVITAHFVDLDWKLQKRVLNFVHLPPPRKGVNIADGILSCLKEWNIQDKVSFLS